MGRRRREGGWCGMGMRGVQLSQVLMRPIHHENVERQSRGSMLARRPALRFESGSAVVHCGTRVVVVGSRASEGVNYPTACSLAAPRTLQQRRQQQQQHMAHPYRLWSSCRRRWWGVSLREWEAGMAKLPSQGFTCCCRVLLSLCYGISYSYGLVGLFLYSV